MILSTLANISSAVSTTVSTAITDWSKRKTVSAETKAKAELLKVETELRVLQIEAQARTAEAQTKLEMAKQGQKIDFELDRESVRQMQKSLKDEFLLLLFSLPVILTFIPSMQPHVQKGWEMLDQAPEWFLWLYAAMIISVWGLRGIARSVLESRFMKK
jgi:hypothetical protein